ncbi:hypothetical protein C8R46DRAFT_1065683 [Mycena filopes]|nr:hypothetical protein C8R46DRAFT_1065683 [Mycena filopes]
MVLYYLVWSLVLATSVPETLAAPQNITLVAGASNNITFTGGGWQGPGGWQGLSACTSPAGMYSWTAGASVTIAFQGTAVYFVGWANSRNGVYQPSLDGVSDSPVSAYIPSGPSQCNVIQYQRTGLSNGQHNLVMALLPDDPGQIGVPGLSISGAIVTTDDSQSVISNPSNSNAAGPSASHSLSGGSKPSSAGPNTPSSSPSPPGPESSSPGSPDTSGSSSHGGQPVNHSFLGQARPGAIAGITLGSTGGLAIIGYLALKFLKLMLGIFPVMVRTLRFRATEDLVGSHEIILTLTPADIDKEYPCEEVVWKEFSITRGFPYTARLKYHCGFGIAEIESGRNALDDEREVRQPTRMAYAKPGWSLPFAGDLGWIKPSKFTFQRRNRIIATNQSPDHLSKRLVIGSYLGEEAEEDDEERAPLRGSGRFQPFIVMDEKTSLPYEGEITASVDLMLRAYKTRTRHFRVQQIVSPRELKEHTVSLLGDEGICLTPLPMDTTWFFTSRNGALQLTMEPELPFWKKILQFCGTGK